jgi:GTPase
MQFQSQPGTIPPNPLIPNKNQQGYPVVALVGYTNSGKSTLLNALTQAGALAEDLMFATLDPTTR